ncbi:hypothetical protein EDB82DRAFT_287988 [Fusarium venenatum]|uniref:uncharacterized protein n=1 Tax=Fusarium venenatum TaxID=56646 RepID=UPI001D7B6679|nr:hypothetical protein EDB82DRAFT_287988 [Fusarium venenatum]
MSSYGSFTQDDLFIFSSSFSSFVASLPTVSVKIEVSQSTGWVTVVRSISYVIITLFTEFVLVISFPGWLGLLMLLKQTTEGDWDAMLPSIVKPYIPAVIRMLFWFTALRQDLPLVSQLFPSTSEFIRLNQSWIAVIIDIMGFKATSSSFVFNVISTVTTARMFLYYFKQPHREIWHYHAELSNSFMFMIGWIVVLNNDILYQPDTSILGFISYLLILIAHTCSYCFYYITFSL